MRDCLVQREETGKTPGLQSYEGVLKDYILTQLSIVHAVEVAWPRVP